MAILSYLILCIYIYAMGDTGIDQLCVVKLAKGWEPLEKSHPANPLQIIPCVLKRVNVCGGKTTQWPTDCFGLTVNMRTPHGTIQKEIWLHNSVLNRIMVCCLDRRSRVLYFIYSSEYTVRNSQPVKTSKETETSFTYEICYCIRYIQYAIDT